MLSPSQHGFKLGFVFELVLARATVLVPRDRVEVLVVRGNDLVPFVVLVLPPRQRDRNADVRVCLFQSF